MSTSKGHNNPEKGYSDQLYTEIGNKIKELRRSRPDLSQEKLAAAIGTTANTVSRWETGQYKPSVGDLEKISRHFGVSINVFFPANEPEARLQALLSATGDLEPEDIQEIVRYAEFRRAKRFMKEKK